MWKATGEVRLGGEGRRSALFYLKIATLRLLVLGWVVGSGEPHAIL
jgi:hypothetical protein